MVFYYGDIYTLFAKLLRIKRKPNLQCLTVHMLALFSDSYCLLS